MRLIWSLLAGIATYLFAAFAIGFIRAFLGLEADDVMVVVLDLIRISVAILVALHINEELAPD